MMPNTWLQATWPRLSERTPNCGFRFPAKMVISNPEGGQAPEPPAVGPHGYKILKVSSNYLKGF